MSGENENKVNRQWIPNRVELIDWEPIQNSKNTIVLFSYLSISIFFDI